MACACVASGAIGVIVAYAQSEGASEWLAMGYIAFNSAWISVMIWLMDKRTQRPRERNKRND